MRSPKSVDQYIAVAPAAVRGRLKELRAAIKTAVPGAEERISYGLPSYHYKGRLVYFGLWKKHIALYALGAVLEQHKRELEDYATATTTLHFPLDRELPLPVIKSLVKAQAKKNDQASMPA
jgi:uncharacterized protein YdhG (YjbR/CyaY superfamily)